MSPGVDATRIQEAYKRCQRRYPTVDLPVDIYQARLEEITSGEARAAFEELRHEDLFLVLACSRGDRIAWEIFADDYAPLLKRMALNACRSVSESDDLAQELITSLLENKSKLAGYSGRASLATWLRVALSHAAIDRFRRARREVSLEEIEEKGRDAVVTLTARSETDVEARLDAQWGPALVQLLAEEIQRLDPRDRLFLNLYYLNGLPLKSIGRQFRIHEATVSRQLDALRKALRRGVERALKKRHRLTAKEIDSLWRWADEEDGSLLREAIKG